MNLTIGNAGNSATPPLFKPTVVVAPRTDQTVGLPHNADSFEAAQQRGMTKKQSASTTYSSQLGWFIGGGVLLMGLAGFAFFQREALASSWEKLFKKSGSAATKSPKPLNELPKPSPPPSSLISEALQAQIDALPPQLKPDVTAYDLTNENQFNALRIYVQGLHELREKPDAKTLCTAINKICSSIGSNNNDCAWMSRAQARRLTGTIENGKPIGKDIDPMFPHVFGYSLLPPQYLELTERFGKKTLEIQGTMPFQEKFRLEEHPLGSNYYIPDPSQAITGGVSKSRSYNEVEQLLKEQENGSLFFLTHNPFEDSNEGHATILANINGEIYFIDNAIEGTWAYTFDDFFKQKLINFEGLSESEKRTPDKVFTRETVLNRMTSAINLNIRKFENLKLHPWLLNQTP